MTVRSYIPFKEKLAAVLCQMLRVDEDGKLVPTIPWEHAKLMSADEVLSLWQWDHYPKRKVDGGEDKHFNLVPLFIGEHRVKTAKIDVPQNSKRKRLSRSQEEFRERVLAKPCGTKRKPTGNWPKRKLQSRGFEKRL